jgi:hypothetical protein
VQKCVLGAFEEKAFAEFPSLNYPSGNYGAGRFIYANGSLKLVFNNTVHAAEIKVGDECCLQD